MAGTKSRSSSEAKKTISNILNNTFGREVRRATYEAKSVNSEAYYVTLGPDVELVAEAVQSGCVHLPMETTKVVFKFTNPDAMLNDEVVVENEVAMMVLFRNALKTLRGRHIVPDVYGWQQATTDEPGWIMMEHMAGKAIKADEFRRLDIKSIKTIIDNIAQVLRLVQQYELPASFTGYGGARFAHGQVVSGATPIYGATKGCDTYHELYTEYLKTQLAFMDKCTIIKGWKDTGLRDRLDKFVDEGFKPYIEEILPKKPRQTLVHADLDIQNLLFDPKTYNITGLVDFNFSHVASVSDEYFYSLVNFNTIIFPPDSERWGDIHRFLLLGETEGVNEETKKSKGWEVATLTSEAFYKADVQRPFDLMPGIEDLSNLYWFIQGVSPPIFFVKKALAKLSASAMDMEKSNGRQNIEKILSRCGY